MGRPVSRVALSLGLLATALAACGGNPTSPTATPESSAISGDIVVYAASSLTNAFQEIGQAFDAAYPGSHVVFNFAGSSTLRTQLDQGAPADVFASADQTQMTQAMQSGVIDGDKHDFATNRLVVITPIGDEKVRTLADLAAPGISLVIALPDVPVGNYARQAIASMDSSGQFEAGFADAVLGNVVSEETNVRQVAAKVALGEADAGIVYSTDVTPDIANQVSVIPIADAFNVLASYPIAKVASGPNRAGADAFIAYVLSADGQAVLAKYGFGSVAQ